MWEDDAHGLELDSHRARRRPPFAARELGATADLRLPRFAQLFLDAADVAAVRAFWVAALGYAGDRRDGVVDIHDPRWLNPVLVFQELDASETERHRQRNRVHVELAVPSDLAQTRLATIVAAGGRLLDETQDRWRVADPEGNEMVSSVERELHARRPLLRRALDQVGRPPRRTANWRSGAAAGMRSVGGPTRGSPSRTVAPAGAYWRM